MPKNFVSDHIELLVFNSLFQNNYFKTKVSQKKKIQVHVFKVPVFFFVISLTKPLAFCVLDYYRKIKENVLNIFTY